MMRYGPSQEGLPGSGGPVQQHALGLRDAQTLKDFRVFYGQFDHFLHFLHLLVQPTYHVVGAVGHLLDLNKIKINKL